MGMVAFDNQESKFDMRFFSEIFPENQKSTVISTRKIFSHGKFQIFKNFNFAAENFFKWVGISELIIWTNTRPYLKDFRNNFLNF